MMEIAIKDRPGPSATDVSQRIIEPGDLMEYSRRTYFIDDDCADLVRPYERQVRPVAVKAPLLTAPALWPHRPKEQIAVGYAEYFTDERCAEIAQRVREGESFSSVCHTYDASAPTIKRYLTLAGWDYLTGLRAVAKKREQADKVEPARSRANIEETAVSVAEPEMVEETAVSVADGKTAVSVADGLDRLISLRRLTQELQAAGVGVEISGEISVTLRF
ncbi:MAG: hypothetical protein R6X32_05920 [Chloroflexota bacterium]